MTSRLPCTSQHALKPINTHRLRLCTPFRATKANSLSGRASLRRHHQSPAAKLARPVSAPANAPVRLPASPPRQVSLLQPNTPIPEQDPHSNGRGKRVVVVGGGWAGFGAAKHLSSQGYSVTLVDAAPNPGGLSAGWRTDQGRAVEAGVKGFWYQYHNIFSLVRELGVPNPFTDWTTSGFWSPQGLTTEAPVFSKQQQYPTLLGQFIHTFPLFRTISLADRLTMLPLLYSILDYDRNAATYEKYDKISAWELFQRYGVSRRLFEEFLKPLLLVGLFAPAEELSAAVMIGTLYFYEELSAAVMIGTLYFYALAHQNDFDVCWCKGSINERIFLPLVDLIKRQGGKIIGGQLVSKVDVDERSGQVTGVHTVDSRSAIERHYEADAVIFAVGITGMKKLIANCPALGTRPEFRAIMNLKGLDVVATRIWLDKRIATRFPANVLAGFEDGVGGTYFNLTELQDEYKDEPGTVIAADFYHANTLLPLSHADIIAKVKHNLGVCEPAFQSAQVVDSIVLRFANAVTHFSPGSYTSRPLQTTSIGNLFMAGDWVKGLNHGANGLSQERAYITGLSAANMVVESLGQGQLANIIPVEADEPHVAAGKSLNRTVQGLADASPLRVAAL